MNRILIVDDEKWVRAGLHASIEKLMLFDVIDEAVSGEDAILKADIKKYDIIITDIKMTDMTGLELIEQISSKNSFTRFIIVSGYSDFEYARTAISLGVDNYLLKPVKIQELKSAIEQSLSALNKSKINEKLQGINENLASDQKYIAFEKILNNVFYSGDEKEITDNNELEKYGFRNKKFVCMATVFLNESELTERDFFDGDTDLLKYGIKNILEETFNDLKVDQSEYFIFNSLHNFNQIFIIITDFFAQNLKDKIRTVMNKLQKRVLEFLELEIKIGISELSETVKTVLYGQCKQAYCQRFLHNDECTYFYTNEICDDYSWKKELLNLKNNIVWRKNDGILSALEQLFNKEYYENTGIYRCEEVYWAILHMFVSMSVEMQLPLDRQFNHLIRKNDSLDDFSRFSQLIKYFYINILEVLGTEKEQDNENAIQWVKEYIEANYAKDIVVSDLAEKLDFHPAYFSAFFKKQTGQNFVKYLAEIRVLKACELLVNSNYSNQEIARMVGYNDPQYFYKVFKSVKGMTPLEYRMKKM